MNRAFKNVAFFFFVGFGAIYLTADFLLHQGVVQSETLRTIYQTFDMPFYFSAGMYALAATHLNIKKRYSITLMSPLFWVLAVLWTIFLVYLNVGYDSFL